MATDPMKVYNAIVRLGGARLDQLVEELKPASRSRISRMIKRLAKQDMIHRAGYEWFPVTHLCSGAGTQVGQVGHSGTQVGQVGQNDVEEYSLENTPHGPRLGEDLLIIADAADGVGFGLGTEEDAETEASQPIGGPSGGQKDVDATAPLSLSLRVAGSEANGSEINGIGANGIPFPVRDMFSVSNNPAVMRHIVLKVRKARSRHNRGEGAKWAQARDKGKFYQMKLVPKDRIEDMEYLADAISGSVALGKWWEDEARHVAEMTRLIPDWRHGYQKALWDLDMVGPIADEPAAEEAPETEPETILAIEPDVDSWEEMEDEAAAEVIPHEDMAGLKAWEAQRRQKQQAEWDAKHAAHMAKFDQEMEAAAAVEVPATPGPAQEAAPSPAESRTPALVSATQPSIEDRILAVVDTEPKKSSDIAAVTGIQIYIVAVTANNLRLRGVIQHKCINDIDYYFAGKAPAIPAINQNDRSDEWPN